MLDAIVASLDSAAPEETFCTSMRVPIGDFTISVKGVGPITCPISHKIAKTLIKESRLASFGWRDQTVVDTRVRNVWEVPKSKIKIPKRNFAKVMTPVLEQIKQGLGLAPEGELSAELHNMVVYEKGQFFTNHQDSEKSDGMVATMVVLLPSAFKGGSLVVDQQGDKRSFRAPAKVGRELRFISFYADCHHEVKKVTSGHRIALTYNLSFDAPGSVAPRSCNPKLVEHINDYFCTKHESESRGGSAHPLWLVYLMDYQYSQKGLSWSQLKGSDRRRAEELCAAAHELHLVTHLALADVHEIWQAEEEYDNGWGYRYDDDDDEYEDDESKDGNHEENRDGKTLIELIEDDYTLAHWVDRNGKKVSFNPYAAPAHMFCWHKANNELEPFESNYEGYMGNYGNTLDRWYHRAAIVLWPKNQEYPSRFAIDPISTLKYITRTLRKDSKLGSKMLDDVFPQWNRLRSVDAADSKEVLEIANLVKNKDQAANLLSNLDLGVICKHNCDGLEALLRTYGQKWTQQQFESWSGSRRYGSEYLSDLSYIVERLSRHTSTSRWLLSHQFQALVDDDKSNESIGSQVALERAAEKQIEIAIDILKAASKAQQHSIFKRTVEHILSHSRVYSNMALASMSIDLHRQAGIYPAWKKIAAQAVNRLESQLSNKRQDGDLSILEEVPCKCADCEILTGFLRSKNQEELVWPLGKCRRHHIHGTIDGMGIGVTHETRRTGSPHKLVLTKTKAHFKREEGARARASEQLRKVRQIA